MRSIVVESRIPVRAMLERMRDRGILAGIDLAGRFPGFENRMLVCVTERHTLEVLDQYVAELRDAAAHAADDWAEATAAVTNRSSSAGADS